MKKIIVIIMILYLAVLIYAKEKTFIVKQGEGWKVLKYFNNVTGVNFTLLKFEEIFTTWDNNGKVRGKYVMNVSYSKYSKLYEINLSLYHNDSWLWGKEGALYLLIDKKRLRLECAYDSKKIKKGLIYSSYCSYPLHKRFLNKIVNSYKTEYEFVGKYFSLEGEFSLKMKKGIKAYIKFIEGMK